MTYPGYRISAWAALLWCPALALGADTLESVQENIIERSRNLTSLEFDMATSSNFSGPGHDFTQSGKGRYEYLKKGEKMLYRLDSKDRSVTKMGDEVETQESTTTMIFDGEFLYTLTESGGKKSAVKMKQESGWVADQAYFDTMKESYDMKLLSDETVDGRSAYVIEARPKMAAQGLPPSTMTMYYDQETGMAIKTVVKDESGKVSSTSTFSNLKVGTSISESRFKFELPPGVELTDMTRMEGRQTEDRAHEPEEEPDEQPSADEADEEEDGDPDDEAQEPEEKDSGARGLLKKFKKKKSP